MKKVIIRLHNKNYNSTQKLTLEQFRNEFRPELKEVIDIYCGRQKVSDFNLDELLEKDTEEIQRFLNKVKVYFNKYINSNWTFVGAIAYDKFLYGTKIYNYDKKEIGLIISTWTNTFSGENGAVYVPFATCVDENGNKYNTEFENLTPYEELDDEDLEELGLK